VCKLIHCYYNGLVLKKLNLHCSEPLLILTVVDEMHGLLTRLIIIIIIIMYGSHSNDSGSSGFTYDIRSVCI